MTYCLMSCELLLMSWSVQWSLHFPRGVVGGDGGGGANDL